MTCLGSKRTFVSTMRAANYWQFDSYDFQAELRMSSEIIPAAYITSVT